MNHHSPATEVWQLEHVNIFSGRPQMARIVIEDLDKTADLRDKDLDSVVAGAGAPNAPSVKVDKLLPETVFPAIGSNSLGL